MAEAVKFRVELRDPKKNVGTGTRAVRKLRARGLVPGVVYGHKQAVTPIALTRDVVNQMIKSPGHLADLQIGSTTETVLIRDVQWDHLGKQVIHLDFARVSAEEVIETEVNLEIRGVPAGLAEGGVLEVVVHTLSVNCKAGSIPESIRVDVSDLKLNESVLVKDLVLPPDVTVNADPDLLLAHVVARAVEAPVAEAAAESPTQPEVIKPERKEKEKEA
jgi:large subunit ribosomal protein L25